VANNTYAHALGKYKVKQTPQLRGELDLTLPMAKLIDHAELQLRATIDSNSIYGIAFSPDSRHVALRDRDGDGIQVCNTTTGTQIAHVDIGQYLVRAVFTPDGSRLIVESSGKTIDVIDTKNWSIVGRVPMAGYSQGGLAVSPTGLLCAIMSRNDDEDGNTITMADTHSGRVSQSHKLSEDTNFQGSLAFSPDGSLLASPSIRDIQFRDAVSGELRFTLERPAGAVSWILYSPDGRTVALDSGVETEDYTPLHSDISVWDVESRQKVGSLHRTSARFSTVHTQRLAYNANGDLLAALSLVRAEGTSSIYGGRLEVMQAHDGAVTTRVALQHETGGVAFHPVHDVVATTYPVEHVVLYHARTGKQLAVYKENRIGRSVWFSPDGKTLAVDGSDGDGDSKLFLFDVEVKR